VESGKVKIVGTVEKIAVGIISIGLVTTLLLPGRQTPAVINAFTGLFRGSLATAMGTGKQV
jgi:hypothetical protein